MSQLPLHGLVVIEFCQYLSGPSAGLRLADLGARVIKIEKPGTGDQGRKLSIKNLWVNDDSLLFHTINRNKESYTAELKDKSEVEQVKKIIQKADVLIHNFRPGVMQKLGLGYEDMKQLSPRLVYGEISGYGSEGPWKDKPGQDLLLQSLAGLTYTTGDAKHDPVPFGIAIADILCGAQLVQGLLAALVRRHRTGKGGLIQVSLLESLLDFQFELLTTYYCNGQQPLRSNIGNGHPLLSAPYGIYATKDGHIALAMIDIHVLAKAIGCEALKAYEKKKAFAGRDEIKTILKDHLIAQDSTYWLEKLHVNGLWAMEVLDWKKMTEHEAYQCLQMEQTLKLGDKQIVTTRCPIRVNGERLFSDKPAPVLGEHNEKIKQDFINTTA
jgi:CoA:oxalate CoA-transferase